MRSERTVRIMTKASEKKAAFTFGVVFVVALLALAFFVPNPTAFQYLVFRVVLALAAAGVAAMVPGFIEFDISKWLRAGGALAVFLIVFFYNPALLVADPLRQDRVTAIKRLADDLEQVKVLLPPGKVIADCLQARSREEFAKAFEACDSESKRNQTHALNILNRNLSNLKLFLSSDQLAMVYKRLEAIRFAAYEMHNNNLTKERWRADGCPPSIDFVDSSTTDKLSRDEQGQVKCVLSVEGYNSFLNRQATNDDPFSAIVIQSMPRTRGKSFIVPGEQDFIEDYFLSADKRLYNSMLGDMDKLLLQLKELVEL